MKIKKIKIGVYGSEGSYSHIVSKKHIKKNKINADFQYLFNIDELLSFVEKGNLGILPIENSTEGIVTQVVDGFYKHNVEIIEELSLKINHCLLVKKNIPKIKLAQITEAFSHPQALSQCTHFLNKNKIIPVSFSDTSEAAKFIKDLSSKNFQSALGSEELARIYKLDILKKNIQNNKDNQTRFFLIKKNNLKVDFGLEKENNKKNKISLIFQTKDIPGSLYKCLGAFSVNNLNITILNSRPCNIGKNKGYFFYVEIDGNLKSKEFERAISELKFYTKKIKILGNYSFKK